MKYFYLCSWRTHKRAHPHTQIQTQTFANHSINRNFPKKICHTHKWIQYLLYIDCTQNKMKKKYFITCKFSENGFKFSPHFYGIHQFQWDFRLVSIGNLNEVSSNLCNQNSHHKNEIIRSALTSIIKYLCIDKMRRFKFDECKKVHS